MRPTCVNKVFELAKRDPRVVYIGSDLSPDLTERMKKEMPGRAFMEGVSAAHVVGMAAASLDGETPPGGDPIDRPFRRTIVTLLLCRAANRT